MSRIVHPGGDQTASAATRDPQPALPGKGPVRVLCDEIGFTFHPGIERADVFIAFVGRLVEAVEEQRWMQAAIAEKAGGKPPSEGSAEIMRLAVEMLKGTEAPDLYARAAAVHGRADELNPETAYPTDHLIDMLVSCASAIRFGLEMPCRSRHAAAAANHVWAQRYGVSLFDSHTPDWEKAWARSKLLAAIVSLLPPLSDGALGRQDAADVDSLRDEQLNPTELDDE